jgi:hypothetical protein
MDNRVSTSDKGKDLFCANNPYRIRFGGGVEEITRPIIKITFISLFLNSPI